MPSSPIDSRVTPNHARTLNGAQIYDIESPDSRVAPALTPSFAVASCGTASGGNTIYSGTFTPAALLPVNSIAEVAGFVNAPNNGAFQIVSVNATTLVLANAAGVAETHAATVIPYFPVDSRVAPNIPVDSRVAPNIPQNSRL